MKNTAGIVDFADRLSKTCSDIQADADNDLITQPNCEALYSRVYLECACEPTTVVTRTETSILELFETVTPLVSDTSSTEYAVAQYSLKSDGYFPSIDATTTATQYTRDDLTDAELIQRYMLLLMHEKLWDANSVCSIDSTGVCPNVLDNDWKSDTWECTWAGVECTYGQVTGLDLGKHILF
jgi:hypothetical protein